MRFFLRKIVSDCIYEKRNYLKCGKLQYLTINIKNDKVLWRYILQRQYILSKLCKIKELKIMKRKTKAQVLAGLAVFGMFAGTFGTQFVSANNHTDTSYYISYNGDGSDTSVSARRKTDATPVYVYNQGTRAQRTSIAGTNSSSDSDVFSYNNCTYNAWYKDVSAGSYKYISSVVYENGYSYAYLVIAPVQQVSCVLKGVWSPDSIGA